MANLQATIRSQTLLNASPNDCLEHSNLHMYQNSGPEKFATLFYGVLDARSHRLKYSNAGHNYPLVFSSGGKTEPLKSDGIVLGCLESFRFQEEERTLSPGDLFVLYSDGVTEAFNLEEEEFEEEVEEVESQSEGIEEEEIIKLFEEKYPNKKAYYRGNETKLFIKFKEKKIE